MDRLTIDTMRDTIIMEKCIGNTVLKGSKFYCGCCGEVLGRAKESMTFPFTGATFVDGLENKSVKIRANGLFHETCRHTMFGFRKWFSFMRLETYISHVPQDLTTAN